MTMTERTTGPTATLRWEPPGPGFWRFDDSHVPQVLTRYYMEVFTEIFGDPETWKGFRDYGLLLAGFEGGVVNGYTYIRVRIAGAPDKPGRGGSPPAFLLKLLLALHPELRYRKQRAAETFATKRWQQDCARWRQELAPAFRQKLLALQQVNPASLADAALREYLHAVRKALVEGYQIHFNLLPADRIPVGDWLRRTCEWTGITPAEALEVLRGRAKRSLTPLTLLDRLAEAVRGSPEALSVLHEARSNASDQVIRLRESTPEVAAALDAYLRDYGDRMVTGYDLCDLTLRELPHMLLGSILAQMQGRAAEVWEAGMEERAAWLRDRVPVARRVEYDALFEEARLTYGLGDENEGLTMGWPLGLVRRAMLTAGRRLVERSLIEQPEHLLDATQAELDALLGGPGTAPRGPELARRAEERRLLNQVTPPTTLGEPETPPPQGILPPDLERLTAAMLFYTMNNFPDSAKHMRTTGQTLVGLGVSQGIYTGQARVVQSPADFDRVEGGDILVAPSTSSGYNVLLPLLGAIVTDRGGAVCHTAIVAREFGIVAVVGTGEATVRIPDGARISVDGSNGTVTILAGASA